MKFYQTRANGEYLNMFRASADTEATEIFENYCKAEERFLTGDTLTLVTQATNGSTYTVSTLEL